MFFVVGSGPTAVSAAFALAGRRLPVTILDVGRTADDATASVVARLGAVPPKEWAPKDVHFLKRMMQASAKGVPLKYVYGSDYPYAEAESGIGLERIHSDLLPSFGAGGLSAVWGAACMSSRDSDLADWPIKLQELRAHYDAVSRFMPVAGVRDGLEASFPLPSNTVSLEPSHQAKALLRDLEALALPNVEFGRSRLAINTDCQLCGMCMYGCPYGQIYDSRTSIDRLKEMGVQYRAGVRVVRVEERAADVVVHAVDQSGEIQQFSGEAIFLGAGVLPTARIAMESFGKDGDTLPLMDSAYYMFPMLRASRVKGAARESLHTLSQVFIEITDPEVSAHSVHLQIYTYNDLFRSAVCSTIPGSRYLPLNPLLERLVVVQGYLHSDYSAPMRLTWRDGRLRLVGQADRSVERAIIRKVQRKIAPLGFQLAPQMTRQGRGFHSGGSFPMRRAPGRLETDAWGRLNGTSRIHLVDASVLPTIPATTITFTAMANAHRIGEQYGRMPVSSARPKTIAITGANGFVGSALARYFRRSGFRVISLTRSPVGLARSFSLGSEPSPELFKDVDYLIHAAYDFGARDPASSREINEQGSLRLFKAAQAAGVSRSIYISSISAYEGCVSTYGRTKLAIEKQSAAWGCVSVRPGLVYGPEPGSMYLTLKRAASKRLVPIIGLGQQIQYLIHEEDLAALTLEILESKETPKAPIVAAHPHPWRFSALLRAIAPGRRLLVPVPPAAILIVLRAMERLGLKSRMHSDSLVSLLTQPRQVDFGLPTWVRTRFRGFCDTR